MNIEFYMYWIVVGLVCDLIMMTSLTIKDNLYWAKFHIKLQEKYGEEAQRIKVSFMDTVRDTPWWAHAGLILFPPSFILALEILMHD